MAPINPKDMSRTGGSRKQKLVARHNGPPLGESWAWVTLDLLNSHAFVTLSVTALRIFWRIMAEHAAHAGKLNGRLRVTHDQFRKRGCTGELVADAIEELEYKGLVKVQRGRAADGTPHPNYYQLTFVGDHEGSPPTNEWKKVSAERCVQWGETERAARAQKRKRKAERQKKSSLREPELARSVNTEPAPLASKAA